MTTLLLQRVQLRATFVLLGTSRMTYPLLWWMVCLALIQSTRLLPMQYGQGWKVAGFSVSMRSSTISASGIILSRAIQRHAISLLHDSDFLRQNAPRLMAPLVAWCSTALLPFNCVRCASKQKEKKKTIRGQGGVPR